MKLKKYQKDLKRLKNSINDAFSIFGRKTAAEDTDYLVSPYVNIVDKGKNIELTVDLPDIDKKSIKVKVENRYLIIQASKNKIKESKDVNYIVKEISERDYYRSFYLSDEMDLESIKADYSKGVLRIQINKKESVVPKEIDIKVS